ncbi:MAG: SWIM zinc finger family protein [Balneolaceae bacterium]
MNLKDFERNISSTMLERGYDYFNSGQVDGLEKIAPGQWLAQVHGTNSYTVQINTHKTKIKGWECDCPYDQGPICKHVVAVFYAIEEMMAKDNVPSKNTKKKVKKNRVQEIFKKTSKEELQEFIVTEFVRVAGLKNAFVAHFAVHLDEDQEQKYKTIVRNIYKSAQGRHGFIDYYSATSLTSPLYELAEKANDLLAGNNLKESLAICKALIEEIPIFLNNMDDSDGSAGDLLYYAFDTFGAAIQQAPPLLKDELFTYCLEELPKEKYHTFGFEANFLFLVPELITNEEQEKQFFKLTDRQIEIKKRESYSDYGVVQLIKAKVEYLLKASRDEEAFALIETQSTYPDLRNILVDKAITQKDFEQAKALCREGINIANDQNHPGTVQNWQQKLLDIAKLEDDTPEIQKLSEKLFFENHYSMNYYKELKATYDKTSWQEKCEALIDKIKGKHSRGSFHDMGTLAEIFAEEKYLDRLLKLLQINDVSLSFVDRYASILKNKYPVEILDLYEKGITNYATQTGRKIYKEIAGYLKKMKKIKGGDEKIHLIIRDFRRQYNNRPAMMEVLNRHFPGSFLVRNDRKDENESSQNSNENLRLF